MAQVHGVASGEWRALGPREISIMLAGLDTSWWIAGGWAIDLFLQEQTRAHKDLDVGIARSSAPEVLARLSGWEFFEAQRGMLFRLDKGEMPRREVNSLWGRPSGETAWELELLLTQTREDRLVFRRCPSIQLPLTNALHHTPEGVRYLAPAFQLLYKARQPRPEDQADFERVLPRLAPLALDWLRQSLRTIDPGHRWLAAVDLTVA